MTNERKLELTGYMLREVALTTLAELDKGVRELHALSKQNPLDSDDQYLKDELVASEKSLLRLLHIHGISNYELSRD